jgi:two-component system chemotaxis sensor kinase CheA
MAIDLNDEILQDFLVEAGEILEQLGEQLVELEQSPDDLDLLNAIFRGFHTVKGGAGFLAIEPLVEVCHKAEDVFNVLRQGDRTVTADLMDVVLRVLDVVTEMFDSIRAGEDPAEADPELLETLLRFTTADNNEGDNSTPAETVSEEAVGESNVETTGQSGIADPANISDVVEQEFESMLGGDEPASADDEITEEEFEGLLDALHGEGGSPTPAKKQKNTVADDEITEEEFEKVLDQLHGEGKFSVDKLSGIKSVEETTGNEKTSENEAPSDEITEEEFEKVLDELHGKGKFKPEVVSPVVSASQSNNTLSPAKSETSAAAKPKKAEKTPKKAAPKKSDNTTAKKSARPQPQGETTVRVDTEVLDEIMNMVGELVLVRNRFQTLNANLGASEELSKAVSNLDVVTADLQLSVMKTRMQPIKKVFGRFPRVVRDLARSLKKEIRLEMVGEDTDLDKNLVEALADPLVHLVRNAVDHGIESPEERVAVGKPREGLVVLTASQEGDHILLSIKDDGKGMNADVLRKKVVEKGLMDEESAARLDDKECYNLIFLPGFSTKTEISDVSGRGVGMDVVKTRISQMNGVVEIDSEEGKGSTIIIKVPLTLAIMPTLMVKLGGQNFALPLANVLEILDLDLRKTNVVDGQQVVMVREKALPLFYLSEWLVNDPSYKLDKYATGHVVVVNASGRQVGFVVDQLIGQEEVVIKPLGAKLHGLDGLSGATITGDGQIALILDVPGLMVKYAA